MRRLSLVLLPFLAAFALLFGLYYGYTGVMLLLNGRTLAAGLFLAFGVMGIVLAGAIWMARKRARSAANVSSSSA